MIDFRRRHIVFGLGVCLGLAGTLSVRAADLKPRSFWVELDPYVPNTVLVTIDTSNVAGNVNFEHVEIELGMYDSAGRRIGVQALAVGNRTNAGWTFITGGVPLQRHAVTYQSLDPRTVAIRGDMLRWAREGALGARPDGESPWIEMSSNSPYIPIAPPR